MSKIPIHLGNRLRLCASFVKPGAHLCDVGTDHAYLPIWLASQHLVSSTVACDVREGPLASAKTNIQNFGLQNQISIRLSDGLAAVKSKEAETIVVTGMGGDLIARIILETRWLYDSKKQIIVQPMTKPSHLRKAMAEGGFALLKESAVFDEKRVYSVMEYQYCPEKAFSANNICIYTGKLTGKSAAEQEYLRRQYYYLRQCLSGKLHSGQSAETELLQKAVDFIQQLLNLSVQEVSQ
jgi:tRNA (adenine22-N1)-methyltransferase